MRALLYVVYLVAVSLGLLEVSLRMGLPKSAIHEERQQIYRQLTDKPRVLVLGDSFSLEGKGSLGSLLKAYFAARVSTLSIWRGWVKVLRSTWIASRCTATWYGRG